ncbi:hypothetical protein, partial [Modestobacter marinus]|uniref:hypothetical protein n=1 Tax=Modestobacter marinus TaxID=477641 RepID=UPI001C9586E1
MAESSSSQDSQFFDDVKAVTTLRNGKVVDNRVGDKVIEDEGVSRASLSEKVNEKKKSENEKGKNIVSEPKRDNFPSNSDDPVASYVPKAPFPSALVAPVRGKKKGASLSEMLEVFKQVHINLPLLDAIKQIPSYAKFLKDLCTQQRKERVHFPKSAVLSDVASAVVQYH